MSNFFAGILVADVVRVRKVFFETTFLASMRRVEEDWMFLVDGATYRHYISLSTLNMYEHTFSFASGLM